MPGRPLVFRFLALAAFLVTVAVAAWLAELRPALVIVVISTALVIAWAIEWLAWREARLHAPETASEAESAEAPVEVEAEAELEAAAPFEHPLDEIPAVEEVPRPAPSEPVVEVEEEAAPAWQPEPLEPLRAVPEPVEPAPPAPAVPPPPAPEEAPVIRLPARTAAARGWNLWDLEHLAREEFKRDPERLEEWQYLFIHLRRFAHADGSLPPEFDELVRESFGRLLEPLQGA